MQAVNGNGRAHPSVLEAEVVRLRQMNARLRIELAAVRGVAGLVPTEYAEAIGFAAFVAYGVSEVRMGGWSGPPVEPSATPQPGRVRPAPPRARVPRRSGTLVAWRG